VNNVLCFPFIFRGALDVGATTINEEMKVATVRALADLTHAEIPAEVASAYGAEGLRFGPEYLIPKPLDPRLIEKVAPAVAKAAMDSGVATRPIEDFEVYRQNLQRFVFRSGLIMKPIFQRAKEDPKRVIYAEGEDERVLRAVQVVVDEGLAQPILVGRPDVVATRVQRLGLRIRPGEDVPLINPQDDPRFRTYWQTYHELMERKGVSSEAAREIVRTRNTVIGALAVKLGDADAMICGTNGRYRRQLEHILDVLGMAENVHDCSAISLVILPSGSFFIVDTYVTPDPTAEEVAEMTLLASKHVRRFGLQPKVALLSHSSFGASNAPSAQKMRKALALLHRRAPDLEVEGEMHADAALNEAIRETVFPNSKLKGTANLLVMPTLDAANIAFNLVKSLGEGLSVGPILLGVSAPAHILTPSVTARGIVNMSAVAVADAQDRAIED
jgi:malate dehydrogenase (oxaloacetate-decarboxylating)(NADP+)